MIFLSVLNLVDINDPIFIWHFLSTNLYSFIARIVRVMPYHLHAHVLSNTGKKNEKNLNDDYLLSLSPEIKKNDYLWLENQSKYSLSRYYSVSREIHTDLVNVRWVIRYHCRIKEYVYIYIYIYTHTYMYVYCSSERELSVLSKKIGIIFFFFCASRLCC